MNLGIFLDFEENGKILFLTQLLMNLKETSEGRVAFQQDHSEQCVGGEQTANRKACGAITTIQGEVERAPLRQWQGDWPVRGGDEMKDIVCRMVTSLYDEEEEGV